MTAIPGPQVSVIYGSPSDANVMGQAAATLTRFGVSHEERAISAHRAPRALAEYCSDLAARGVRVVIAGAALAAALPGAIASQTTLPVIGVPIRGGALDGVDALLAISQMPPGVPVACVGLDNATNAAVLAVQILALADADLSERLRQFKDDFETAASTR